MAMKQALDAVARRLGGDQVPGKGKATYTKSFVGGVICEDDVVLKDCFKKDAPCCIINANSDGKRGSGKRVKRSFPQWAKWSGVARFADPRRHPSPSRCSSATSMRPDGSSASVASGTRKLAV